MSALHVVHSSVSQVADIDHLSDVLTVCFARECGFRPLPWMKRGFRHLLEEGFEYQMLVQVIEQTSHAPRPSWAYLSAIISRARMNGNYTFSQFMAQPHRSKDRNYRLAHFFDDINPDVIDEAIRNFEP